MEMIKAKLADITIINPTLSDKLADENQQVAFVPMASVLADPPQVKVAESRILSSVKSGFSYFQDGDILVAKITPCFENGKIAQARIKFRHGFGSTEFHVVPDHVQVLSSVVNNCPTTGLAGKSRAAIVYQVYHAPY